MTNAIDQLLEHDNQNDSRRLIIVNLGLIKNFYRKTFEQSQLSSNSQQSINTSKRTISIQMNNISLPVTIQQIINDLMFNTICYFCIEHNDHNALLSSLEILDIIL
ncbi:unnamed protein product [Rotaria sp. Silwood2]|nr:unnamed protein product [Rotaria sp. Silwood2]CAF4706918.1 unnamed protein product [Rotaria sp. Silwood2]